MVEIPSILLEVNRIWNGINFIVGLVVLVF